MAKAKKLPSGSWRVQVYSHNELVFNEQGKPVIDPKTGAQKQKRVYVSFTSDDPSPAGRRAAEYEAAQFALTKQTAQKGCNLTFGEALDKYISDRESILSPRTIMDYKRIRKKEIQDLMDIKVNKITQELIQSVINKDAQAHSPKTVRNNHGLISAVIKQYRPGFAINTDLPKKVRPEIYVPSDEEIKRLISLAADTDLELPILLAAFGPMRRGEICALESKDISGNIVHVSRNMVLNTDHTWIVKAPKSYAGNRYIDYPDFVSQKWKNIKGRITELNPNRITEKFRRLLIQAEMPLFRFHDLRHYSASIQHALGIPDAYIMQRGGWGNDGVLKAVYRHAMTDKAKEMTQKANTHFESLCNTEYNTKTKEP